MNKLMTKITTKMGKVGLVLKKHEPEILVVAGAIGAVGSTVLACRATLKVSEVLDEHKDTINTIHDAASNEELKEEYTAEDEKKDVRLTYFQTGIKIAKLYAPSVILGTLSLGAMFASNNMLKKRNVALATAYAAIDKSFKEYRGRVVDKYGEEVDKELRYGTRSEKIKVTEVDPETGEEKTVKKEVKVADPNLKSDYAMYFNRQTSAYYDECYDYNLSMLRATESYFTTLLQTRGHVTLNEVLNHIGIASTKAGMVVGWYYDKKNPDSDDQIDLRIQEIYLDNHDGTYEKTIVIDPNVQGSIYELMEDK